MRSFLPKVLRVVGVGAQTLKPVSFQGRMDELTLEKHVASDPNLMGEALLVLGQQLAEFEEDKDRLDILAIDTDGEIVLVELKVTDDFRVTDLQALAYAGAYATRETDDLAHTLRRYLDKRAAPAGAPSTAATSPTADGPAPVGPMEKPARETPVAATVTLEQAKARIVEFLQLDDFESWSPSQRVRVKLVAPTFPRRVLKNVKYLGDVYGMPIEAIAARLFETPDEQLIVAFERLLPLPGEEVFDMTLRRQEERKHAANVRRRQRPSAVPLLIAAGKLVDGQTLYLHKSVLPTANRHLFDPEHVAFQVTVRANDRAPAKFAWRPDPDTPAQEYAPSAIAYELAKALLDYDREAFSTAVATTFTVEPNGKTLADIALDEGLWSPAEAAE
jgi:hypothetical protein